MGFCLFRPVICLLLMMLLFLLLLLLLFFFFCCSDYCLFCCSPAYAFSGRPRRAGCRERSQRSCLRRRASIPDAKPGLQRPERSRHPFCRAVACSRHPGKRRRDVGQRRFANRASRRCGGSLPVVLSGAIHLFKPLSPGLIQPQPAALTVQVNEQPTKFLPKTR